MKKVIFLSSFVACLTISLVTAKNIVKSNQEKAINVEFIIDQKGFPQVTYIYDNGNINQMEKIVNQIESIQYSKELKNKVFNVKYINK